MHLLEAGKSTTVKEAGPGARHSHSDTAILSNSFVLMPKLRVTVTVAIACSYLVSVHRSVSAAEALAPGAAGSAGAEASLDSKSVTGR